jgi:dynein heavy chain 2
LLFFFKLLALTIQHEKPDLEEQKTKLLQQEEDKKIQLARLEESLLEVTSFHNGFHIVSMFIKHILQVS